MENIISRLNLALKNCSVRLYHGTRLSDEELKSIKCNGLKPLVLKERRELIASLLHPHEKWKEVEHRLDEVLLDFGQRNKGGVREDNSVHACFSRMGLIWGCSHYLNYGAEVDGHIVDRLFGSDNGALELLKKGRNSYLVSFVKPYKDALKAADPYGSEQEQLPSLLKQLINVWAYRQYDCSYQPSSLKDCTAAIFKGGIKAYEIEAFELLSSDRMTITKKPNFNVNS